MPRQLSLILYQHSSSKTVLIYSLRAFLHQPPASSFHDIYITPVHYHLWGALVGFILLTLVSIHVICWVHFGFKCSHSDDQYLQIEPVMWLVGTLLQQGWHTHPQSIALRTVCTAASITSLLCYIAYASKIISLLSLETVPIRNLEDLFKSTAVPIYASDDSVTVKEIVKVSSQINLNGWKSWWLTKICILALIRRNFGL